MACSSDLELRVASTQAEKHFGRAAICSSMQTYIHTYTHVCMCIYIYIYTFMYMSIYISLYIL